MENQKKEQLKSKTVGGIFWSFGERILAQLVSFVVSIVLARMIVPEEYGIISIVMVVISICNVFVTSGFSTSLVQKKNADDTDFSSVFYFGLVFSIILYIGVFFSAPLISKFYEYDSLTNVIRVMSVTLIISSVKSVQHAKISRDMKFRKFFWSTLFGTIISAVVGVVMAYFGMGVWALVAQYLTNNLVDTLILSFTSRWRPKWKFSFKRLKVLLSFGWKVLLSSLLFTIYNDLRTLVIGKVYSSEDLAYYDKGKQFPRVIVANIDSALSSALLPVMSKMQDDLSSVKGVIRRSMRTGSYIVMPMVVGLAVIAEPMVSLLLTDKWLFCVPYLQLMCFAYALLPLQTANTQAVLAVGRSGISLKTEIIKRGANILILLVTFKLGVFALVIGEVVATLVSYLVNTIVSKKLFGYGPLAQLKDLIPFILVSLAMGAIIFPIKYLPLTTIVVLVLQILFGVIIYVALSAIFKIESFRYILNIIKPYISKIFAKFKRKK